MIKAQEKKNELDLAKVTLDVCNSLNIVSIHDCYNSGGSQGHVGIIETTQSYQEEGDVLGKAAGMESSSSIQPSGKCLGKGTFRFTLVSTGDNYARY